MESQAKDSICVTCGVAPSAEGCRQCDSCTHEANRLWLSALHLRRLRVLAAEELRRAERAELEALNRFNEINSTALRAV